MKVKKQSKQASSRRKTKPIKATYKEIIESILTPDLMIEEDRLLTQVVCKKYKTPRARKARKLSVSLKLKEGEKEGEFRKVKVGGKNFWRKGDGSHSESIEQREDKSAEQEARDVAAKLELFLLNLASNQLKNAATILIPARIEKELDSRWNSRNNISPVSKIELLKFASIRDFGWIITENWSYFSPYFDNKSIFISKINEMGEYRNKLIHPNLGNLSTDELRYFTLAVKIFIKKSKTLT